MVTGWWKHGLKKPEFFFLEREKKAVKQTKSGIALGVYFKNTNFFNFTFIHILTY